MTLEVTEADRNAAADIAQAAGRAFVAHIIEGMEDDTRLVQGVAQLRLQEMGRDA